MQRLLMCCRLGLQSPLVLRHCRINKSLAVCLLPSKLCLHICMQLRNVLLVLTYVLPNSHLMVLSQHCQQFIVLCLG